MSGDSSTSTTSRFSTIKKYPGSPMSSNTTHSAAGARAGNSRNRVLMSKVAAPRPINLPSLRRENAASSEWPASTAPSSVISSGNGGGSGWGSPSPAASPFSSPHKADDLELKPDCQSTTSSELNNSNNKPTTPMQLSPVLSKASAVSHETLSPSNSPHSTPSRVWAAPTSTAPAVPAASADFPTAAEAVATESVPSETKKPEQNDRASGKSVLLEPEHLDWDEMVRQDLEAHIDDDGQEDTLTPSESETVLPSDRFTEDYDRSYPPHIRQVTENHDRNDGGHHSYKGHRENQRRESGHNNAYEWREGHGREGHGRPGTSGSTVSNGGGFHREHEREREWRSPAEKGAPWGRDHPPRMDRDRSRSQNRSERRASNDKKLNFQPTVLKRPRRMSEQSARSERSRDEHTVSNEPIPSALDSLPETPPTRPTELTAAQREVMLSAAERAKKRRDEEEAEREAARERARQKALALAPVTEKQPNQPVGSTDEDNNDQGLGEAHQDSSPQPIVSNDERKIPAHEKTAESNADQPKDVPSKVDQMDDGSERKDLRDKAPSPKKKAEEKNVKDDDGDEDVAEWNDYVENLRDNKSRGDSKGTGASAWNAYAERLQVKDEERWYKSVDQYAAERNLDPAIFRDLRRFDKPSTSRFSQDEGNCGKEQGKRRERKGGRGERRRSTSGKHSLDNEEMWPSLDKAPARKAGNNTATEVAGRTKVSAAAAEGASRKASLCIAHVNDSHDSKDGHDGSAVVEASSSQSNVEIPSMSASHPSESSSTESKALVEAVSTPTEEEAPNGQSVMKSGSLRVKWDRKELRDLLLQSEGPMFPPEVERLVGKKPPHLSFMINKTASTSPNSEEERLERDRPHAAYSFIRENVEQIENNEPYAEHVVSQRPSMPFNTPGNPNYPVLFYQMPFSNGSYMPNTPMYAVRPEQQQQQQQQGSFVHAASPSQQQQQQQQRFVYLLPPQHMIPPWPGMPVQFNNPRRHR